LTVPRQQVAGLQHRSVGDVVVSAINDGFIVLPAEVLCGVAEDERDRIYQAAGRRAPFASAINAYLVRSEDRTVLIDAGSGQMMGPLAGRVPANLDSAGVGVDDVDAVLMTHLHPDHAGGLLDHDGGPRYPRAELFVPPGELEFWMDDANRRTASESIHDTFELVPKIVELYGERLSILGSAEPLPGVEAIPLPGHTVGHTGYMVRNGEEALLIWGDICHAPEVQCERPDVTVIFDHDPDIATRTRHDIFDRAVTEDLAVAGMHMSFPGFSRLAKWGSSYALQPEQWQYDLAATR
jgi:glyoxylase-like metal-dependent hydrolase (beta-lactamase superfamily II)